MKEALLIDYLEEAAGYLSKKTARLKELNRQYREVYDKQIREEMDRVRKEIGKKRAEIVEMFYENIDELRHLKKYYPDLLEVFMEDENLGKILRKKSFLFENSKPLNEREALKKLNEVIVKRRKLRDAKKFLHKWSGSISGKQLGATYPTLKGKIKGSVDKYEAVEIIKDLNAELRKEGWMIIINSPLVLGEVNRFAGQKKMLEFQEVQAKKACDDAKGRGTATEYNAQKKLEGIRRKKHHIEKMMKHLLLTNTELLATLKKSRGWSRGRVDPVSKFAETVPLNRIKEKTWLEKMKKRLS